MKTQKYPNLTPWQPGQSGNPSGRKPGSKNMSTIVQELLDQEADTVMLARSSVADMIKDTSITYAKAVVLATISRALEGNMHAIAWLAEQQERGTDTRQVLKQEPIIVSRLKPRNESAVDLH